MATRADQSTWLVERAGSPSGNFELIAACPPPARGLAHYWHDHRLGFTAAERWTEGDRIRKAPFYGPFTGSALIINNDSDLDMVAAQEDGALAHFERSGIYGWRGPIFLPGRAAGPPAFIWSRFCENGKYEVVAPTPEGGLSHFRRDNAGGKVWREAPRPVDTGAWSGLGLIHSSFGNLEIAGVRDGRLVFLWQNGEGGAWSAPEEIAPGLRFTGRPGFIQGGYGNAGNFEVVAPLGDGLLAHLWRNNDTADFPWAQASVFGADRRGRTRAFDDVALIQSSFGRLEVVARLAGRAAIEHFCAYLGIPWDGPGRALTLAGELE
jgi:hypothetical protein